MSLLQPERRMTKPPKHTTVLDAMISHRDVHVVHDLEEIHAERFARRDSAKDCKLFFGEHPVFRYVHGRVGGLDTGKAIKRGGPLVISSPVVVVVVLTLFAVE